MMRTCDRQGCQQWAQWHAIKKDEQVPLERRERIRMCQVHKDEHQREFSATYTYQFVGVEPWR